MSWAILHEHGMSLPMSGRTWAIPADVTGRVTGAPVERGETTAAAPGGSVPTTSATQLRIHSGDVIEVGRLRWLVGRLAVLRVLRGRCVVTGAGLQVDDLQGRRFYSAEHAGSLTAVALPAGTYHVKACWGDVQRRYTVTLEPGATVDLHLRRTAAGSAQPTRQGEMP